MTERELVIELDRVLGQIGILKEPHDDMSTEETITHALRCAVMYMDEYPEPDDGIIYSFNKYATMLCEEVGDEYTEFLPKQCEECGLLIRTDQPTEDGYCEKCIS